MLGFNHQLPVRLLVIVTFGIFVSAALAQQPVKTSSVFTPLSLNVTADSSVVSACTGEGTSSSRVQLSAKPNAPSGHPIRYQWSTNAGRIDAEGATVTWDLAGLEPGYYQALVHANTSNGEEVCEVFSSTTVLLLSLLTEKLLLPRQRNASLAKSTQAIFQSLLLNIA